MWRMALTTAVVAALALLLVVALGFTYLMYVRMRELQKELESMRSRVEIHDDELEQIESSLSNVDL
ncbi:MAG: hypothetical protein ACI9QA_000770 [Methanobacteriota archaeon]